MYHANDNNIVCYLYIVYLKKVSTEYWPYRVIIYPGKWTTGPRQKMMHVDTLARFS